MSKKPARLRFEKPTQSMNEFFELGKKLAAPNGRMLNSVEWIGREPRSCAVVHVNVRAHYQGEPSVTEIDIEYRPKGFISYEHGNRYDRWDYLQLNQAEDGTLLDANGEPLKEGDLPTYTPRELFHDTDFNDLDFGSLVDEQEIHGLRHFTNDQVFELMRGPGKAFKIGGNPSFMAPRRARPHKKIILSAHPSGEGTGRFGERIVNIFNGTPQLQQVVAEKITQLVCDFLEGKVQIMHTMTNNDSIFLALNKTLVDCGPNADGLESLFDILHLQAPVDFLDDLARRLASLYEIDVAVVDGQEGGILISRNAIQPDPPGPRNPEPPQEPVKRDIDQVKKSGRFIMTYPMYYVATISDEGTSGNVQLIRDAEESQIVAVPVFTEEYLAEKYRDAKQPDGTILPIPDEDRLKRCARSFASFAGANCYGIDPEEGSRATWIPFAFLLSDDPDIQPF